MKHRSERVTDYVKQFDYVGAFLYTLGLLLFIMGLSWGGSVHPWKSAAVIATLLVGVGLLVAFTLWEIYAPLKEPLVPMHLFRNIPWVMSTVVLGVGAGMYYAFAIIWPSMVAVLYADGDQMYGGWLASLVGLGLLAGEIIGGLLATPLGKVKFQMIFAVTCALIFFASKSSLSLPPSLHTNLTSPTQPLQFALPRPRILPAPSSSWAAFSSAGSKTSASPSPQ
jgi:MFS family permease